MPTSCYPLTFRGSLIEREGWAKNRLKDLNLNKNSLKPSKDPIGLVVIDILRYDWIYNKTYIIFLKFSLSFNQNP